MNAGSVYQIRILRTIYHITLRLSSYPQSIIFRRKHLIVSIGEECYLTLPKGQMIPTQSAADHVDVPGGGHVLIVPITHYPTLSSIPPDLVAPIIEETDR
jgi:hypothetical protein